MNTVVDFVFDHASAFLTLAGMMSLCCVILGAAFFYDRRASILKYLEHRRDVRIQRGILMGKKKKSERQAYLNGLVADALTNTLEEAWFSGKVTRDEANGVYRAIGKTHHIPDLLPHLDAASVKAAIRARRSNGIPGPKQDNPAWGSSTTSTDDKPPTGANVINAKKRFGAKAFERLEKTA